MENLMNTTDALRALHALPHDAGSHWIIRIELARTDDDRCAIARDARKEAKLLRRFGHTREAMLAVRIATRWALDTDPDVIQVNARAARMLDLMDAGMSAADARATTRREFDLE